MFSTTCGAHGVPSPTNLSRGANIGGKITGSLNTRILGPLVMCSVRTCGQAWLAEDQLASLKVPALAHGQGARVDSEMEDNPSESLGFQRWLGDPHRKWVLCPLGWRLLDRIATHFCLRHRPRFRPQSCRWRMYRLAHCHPQSFIAFRALSSVQ